LRSNTKLIRMLRCFGAAAAAAMLVVDCGGGGGSSNTAPPSAPVQNQVAVTVAQGVSGTPNIATTSVTICVHGTTTCQTIDNVQVDTESFGLRLASDAILPQVLNSLPTETAGGGTLAECTIFGDGYTWGTVRTADLTVGGETASSLPIAIIGDLAPSTAPSNGCSSVAPQPVLEATAAALGANGILGVGVAPYDCGLNCNVAANSGYYTCPNSGGCSQTAVSTTQAVTNPVVRFATDNNGVILTMSAITSSTGTPSASGTLTFGIGTQSNNAMTASTRYTTNGTGDLRVPSSNGAVQAFFDSGSNGYFFSDSSITTCTNFHGFYCPSTTQTRDVTVAAYVGSNTTTVSMSIADAASLFATGNLAFNDLGGTFPPPTLIDIGLPFFYGKTVFYGIDQSASGGQSPYIAF